MAESSHLPSGPVSCGSLKESGMARVRLMGEGILEFVVSSRMGHRSSKDEREGSVQLKGLMYFNPFKLSGLYDAKFVI